MKKIILVLICFMLPAFAYAVSPSQFYVGAYGGYGKISGGYRDDGDVVLGRLALGLEATTWQKIIFGIEAGIQSGNSMRLDVSPAVLDASGGLPIQATLKPLVDFLITTKFPLTSNQVLYGLVKVGGAFRQMQLDNRVSSRDGLRRIQPELQAGLSYQLAQQARVTAYYEGIYAGSNAGVTLASNSDVMISRIPTQQAAFIGFEYSL